MGYHINSILGIEDRDCTVLICLVFNLRERGRIIPPAHALADRCAALAAALSCLFCCFYFAAPAGPGAEDHHAFPHQRGHQPPTGDCLFDCSNFDLSHLYSVLLLPLLFPRACVDSLLLLIVCTLSLHVLYIDLKAGPCDAKLTGDFRVELLMPNRQG